MARSAAERHSLAPRPLTSPNGWHVWGNDAVVAHLRRALANDHPAHAYVVSGPNGVGKTTLALDLATVLVCQDATREDRTISCGRCLGCQKVARGVHPDVRQFSLDSQAANEKSRGKNTTLTIETAREIRASTALRPVEASWQVLIVDDAETLQGPAQEALLKTLEEPPLFVVLIMLADDADLLLPTIRSRCQRVDLRPVTRSVIEQILAADGVDPIAAMEIADAAAGLPGWARRAAADRSLVDAKRVQLDEAIAWISGSQYERIVSAIRAGDRYSKRRDDVFRSLDMLIGVWRDLLLLHVSQPHYLTYRGIAERLTDLARQWDLRDLHRALQSACVCMADLESNVRPRLAMEAMVLQWPISPNHQQT